MTTDSPDDVLIDLALDRMVQRYEADTRMQHVNAIFLPNRDHTLQILDVLRRVFFPGFFDEGRLTTQTIRSHTRQLLKQAYDLLYEQARQALRYDRNISEGSNRGDVCEACDEQAVEIARLFFDQLPALHEMLGMDVQAAFDGDPAATCVDETIFCYPGVYAIFVHRIAHALYQLKTPMLPRIMSESAHERTGIDIHPGAAIGRSFFIDHGTGVVIGETTVIGDRVKVYQGVTLGALSTKGGQAWRGRQRHPRIEDDVTIYGGAIILGGETVIGAGCTIGGSVFINSSIPPNHTVTMKLGELEIKPKRVRKGVIQGPTFYGDGI